MDFQSGIALGHLPTELINVIMLISASCQVSVYKGLRESCKSLRCVVDRFLPRFAAVKKFSQIREYYQGDIASQKVRETVLPNGKLNGIKTITNIVTTEELFYLGGILQYHTVRGAGFGVRKSSTVEVYTADPTQHQHTGFIMEPCTWMVVSPTSYTRINYCDISSLTVDERETADGYLLEIYRIGTNSDLLWVKYPRSYIYSIMENCEVRQIVAQIYDDVMSGKAETVALEWAKKHKWRIYKRGEL